MKDEKPFSFRRRPGPLSRLGGRAADLWRRLSGAAPPAPPRLRPRAELPRGERWKPEEAELKIAVPKFRSLSRPRPARTGPMAEAALKKKFPAPPEEAPPARPEEPAPPKPAAGTGPEPPAEPKPEPLAEPKPEPKPEPRPLPAPARPEGFLNGEPEKKPAADKAAATTKPPRRGWRLRAAALALFALAAAGGYGAYRQYFHAPPRAKVARIPASSLPKVAPLRPGFFEAHALELAESSEASAAPGSNLGQVLEAAGLKERGQRQGVLDCLTGGDDPVGVIRPGALVRVRWADRERMKPSLVEFQPGSGAAPWLIRPKEGGGYWRYSPAPRPLTITEAGDGTVDDSLWNAGLAAGLDGNLIMSMADILASDIDFLTDVKKGDAFQILYSRDYLDGHPVNAPVIELVKMENNGRTVEYFRYINAKGQAGFYNRDGQSSLKTFFVTPLQYTRISSGFSMARRHPIYKIVRPHQGVDYAAPTGTPVSAVAAGKVTAARWSGGFGRLAVVKHDAVYTTMYGHLSSFGPGIKEGATIKQGDLIGRVGATGAATGPHLDFRLLKNGVPVDPIPELAKQIGRKLEGADSTAFASVAPLLQKRLAVQLRSQAARRQALSGGAPEPGDETGDF